MSALTFYFKDAVPVGATLHRSLQDGGTLAQTTTGTGWNPGTLAAGQSCLQQGGTVVPTGDAAWGVTLQPSAAPSQTNGDCWRTENTYFGRFANANWLFTLGFRAVTSTYTGRFKIAVRVWRSTDPNGVGAIELTGGRVVSAATIADLGSSTLSVPITWTPGAAFDLSNEYLFVNVGIEITAAGNISTQDVLFRAGVGGLNIVTPDFVSSGAGIPATRPFASVIGSGGGIAPNIPPGLKSERGRPGPALRALMRWHDPAILYDQPGFAPQVAGGTASGSVQFAGSGSVSAVGKELAKGSAAFAGVATFAIVGKELAKGSTQFAGIGALSGVGKALAKASSALAGSGSFSLAGKSLARGLAALAGMGAFAAAGRESATASVAFVGVGAFAPTDAELARGVATLAGSGALSAVGKTLYKGSATFLGVGSLAAVGNAASGSTVHFAGTATFAPVGAGIARASTAFAGVASLAPVGHVFAGGSVAFAGSGLLNAQGGAPGLGTGHFSGLGAFAPIGRELAAARADFAASGTLAAAGFRLSFAQGSVAFSGSSGFAAFTPAVAVEGGAGAPPVTRAIPAPIVGRIRTAQAGQIVRARATLTLVVSAQTRQAGQSVAAECTVELTGQVVTAQAPAIRGFGWLRTRATVRSGQGRESAAAAVNMALDTKIISGVFPREPPPTYDGPPSWAPDDMPSSFRNAA